jgi:hypothetical protein
MDVQSLTGREEGVARPRVARAKGRRERGRGDSIVVLRKRKRGRSEWNENNDLTRA